MRTVHRLALIGIALSVAFLSGCGEEGAAPEGIPGIPTKAKQIVVLRIGDTAPPFTAESTSGEVVFPDGYKGRWIVLFSHPGDFNPVCTTEFMQFALAKAKFDAMQCDLIALSAESVDSHLRWLKEVRGIILDELRT